MAEVMGEATDGDGLADAFEKLNRQIGLPTTLREMGVTREDLAGIPAAAMQDHSTPSNPRELAESDCLAVLEAAF